VQMVVQMPLMTLGAPCAGPRPLSVGLVDPVQPGADTTRSCEGQGQLMASAPTVISAGFGPAKSHCRQPALGRTAGRPSVVRKSAA
jgi:hypothetical protein